MCHQNRILAVRLPFAATDRTRTAFSHEWSKPFDFAFVFVMMEVVFVFFLIAVNNIRCLYRRSITWALGLQNRLTVKIIKSDQWMEESRRMPF
jgi:hypothetical protein